MEEARGKEFEAVVEALLEELRVANPDSVKVVCQPRLRLHNSVEVVPDFELTYSLPFQVSRILIECQDRTRSSHDVIRKISYVKAHSPHNRVVFVYKDRSLLSSSMLTALEADGVTHYSLAEFVAMLFKLSNTLEALRSSNLDSASSNCSVAAPTKESPARAEPRSHLSGFLFLIDMSKSMRVVALNVLQRLWYLENMRPQALAKSITNGHLFLPSSLDFLRRFFRSTTRKKRLGSGFAEEVAMEILRDSRKEEVSWSLIGLAA